MPGSSTTPGRSPEAVILSRCWSGCHGRTKTVRRRSEGATIEWLVSSGRGEYSQRFTEAGIDASRRHLPPGRLTAEMFGASGISIDILIFAVALVYANLFEYAFHRWLMHRLHGFVKREHMIHHGIFRGDHRYHVLRSEDRQFILFEWWQGLVIIGAHLPAFWAIGAITGRPVWWLGLLALGVYYAAYEYLHWCMHNPCNRSIERTALFRYLDRNHQLHHSQLRINFNVVAPFADLVFGTLQQTIRPPGGEHSDHASLQSP